MKKLFAFFLAVALLSTLVPFSAFRVSAISNYDEVNFNSRTLADWPIRTSLPTEGQSGWQYYSYPINTYPLSPYNGGNCTWYAYGRAYEVHGFDSGLSNKGNACYWYWAAYENSPWQVDKVPAAGAILCWEGGTFGYGHVAFVERVNADGTVTWTESNYAEAGQQYPAFRKVTMNPADYSSKLVFQGYIHVGTPKGSTPNTPPSLSYENITPGTYAVKNNHTGTYMCVSYGSDTNLQNVDMYNEINVASRMVITKASTGYKIRPECCASRLVNPYGYTVTSGLNVNIYNDENDSTQWWQFQKVSGGYVIRNVQNPDCVLDTDGGNVFVSSYTGASTQIWSLISTVSLATPTISFNKSSYTLGEAVNISWKASPAGSNLSHYWITIVDPNGKEVVGKGLGSSVTSYKFTPSSAGTYSVKVYATPVGSQSGEGSLTDTKSFTILSPHTHSYSSWKTRKAATCSSNGTEYRTCSCGAEETRTTSALGHNYTSVITKPTCTKGGYTTYTCSRCSHSYTGNSTSAKGHTPGSAATCTSAQKCTTCGVTITAAKGHTPGSAATCTSAQKCTTCGVTITAAKGHTPGSAATCTSAQKCTTCGVTITAAKGHTPGAAATCTKDQTCSTCGEVIDHAKGHDEGKWEILEDGSKERRCIKCGHLLETVPATKPMPDPDIDVALGDVNKDGLIDQFDYILVKRHYFATRLLTDNELLRADINRDEIIDQFDYILIKRIYFGTYTIG